MSATEDNELKAQTLALLWDTLKIGTYLPKESQRQIIEGLIGYWGFTNEMAIMERVKDHVR